MKRIIGFLIACVMIFSAVFVCGTAALADSAEDILGVSLSSTLGAKADAAAREVVSAAAGLSDYGKIAYYVNWIDANNAYNYEAYAASVSGNASSGSTQTGATHAAWVFDGDASTKTACWGYARAFQYLCDLTSFNSSAIRCYTVVGKIRDMSQVSDHVWNVVHMDDGKNYLVDAVNCDVTLSDELHASAYPDQVMMHGYSSGNLTDGYTFSAFNGYSTLTYMPGESSMKTLGSSILTLSSTTYAGAPQGTWSRNGNKWYYNENGSPVKGWKQIGGLWFYFDSSTGVMRYGWQNIGGYLYYLDPNTGVMQTGTITVDGVSYTLNSSGQLVTGTGWVKQYGSWYYLDADGTPHTGWLKVGSTWYYMNESGVMQVGWVKVNGNYYYLTESGAMKTGWLYLYNGWYYMKPGGDMAVGWVKVGSTWYYMNSSGRMYTGWLYQNGTWYYLTSGGAMGTGWQKIDGTWYYMDSSGAMETGWLKVGSTWYYLKSNGAMAADTTLTIDGTNYTFNSSGAWIS